MLTLKLFTRFFFLLINLSDMMMFWRSPQRHLGRLAVIDGVVPVITWRSTSRSARGMTMSRTTRWNRLWSASGMTRHQMRTTMRTLHYKPYCRVLLNLSCTYELVICFWIETYFNKELALCEKEKKKWTHKINEQCKKKTFSGIEPVPEW